MKKTILRKAKRLLVPYFSFGIGYWILWLVLHGKETENPFAPFYALVFNGINGLVYESALWFLPALFVVYNVFSVVDRKINQIMRKTVLVILLSLIGCAVTGMIYTSENMGGGYLSAGLSVLSFFLVGTLVREHKDFLKERYHTLCRVIPFTGIAIANTVFIFVNGKIGVRTGEWAFWPLSLINALTAIWIYLCIAVLICKKTSLLKRIMCCIGENSIVFVCTNHMIIRISRKLLEIQKHHFPDCIILQETLVFIISVILMTGLSKIFSKTKLRVFIGT